VTAPAKFGVVVLTQGKRPDDLGRALASVLAQSGVGTDVVVVGNAWQPTGLPAGVRGLGLPENLGIPAGRNAGVPLVTGDLLFFLDDDACLPTTDVLARMAKRFATDPRLGLIQPRVVDPAGLPAPRRWTPRIRVGNPARSSPAMSTWEGAVAIRRDAFDYAGGWPEPFWYAHEGIELAWRVWDAGYRAGYDGEIEVHHPAIKPTRSNRRAVCRGLDGSRWRPVAVQGGVGGDRPRLPGWATRELWRASADRVADGVADGQGRSSAGDLNLRNGRNPGAARRLR